MTGALWAIRTKMCHTRQMDTVDDRAPPQLRFTKYDCNDGCPVEAALEQVAGKWKGVIVYHLLEGTLRFNELNRRIGAVSQRTLTKQLRDLEADGIVERTVHPVVPPHVDYALTDKGRKLQPVVEALHVWGSRFPRAK